MEQKKQLRKTLLAQRNLMPIAQKKVWDDSLVTQLKMLVNKLNAKTVHTFIPMADEVDILPFISWLLDKRVQVICPKSLPKRTMENKVLRTLTELEIGMYGTQHPANAVIYKGSYDLIIVPGLAFDRQGYRMGYGAGYYDEFLAQHPQAYTVGICYPFQLVKKVPTEPHDVQLADVLSA